MNNKLNILVTGKNGQLGSGLQVLSKNYPQYNWFFEDREGLDIGDENSVKAYFATHKTDFCINCAAYTAVDKAEQERDLAFEVNANGPKYLALECKKQNSTLIHISTDYVFDGKNFKPYLEDDLTNPVNYYGQTKLDGEKLALQNNPKTIIIRTSWVYSTFGKNFVKTIIKLATEKSELGIVGDQIGTPTNATDLAFAIVEIIKSKDLQSNFGIYHFSNLGVASWYDFAFEIIKLKNLNCNIKPILSKDFPTPANRPFYSVMDKTKIIKDFNLQVPHWKQSLEICLKQI
jgi:dTDP-4-dehydrorhamnose reductase